MPGQFKIKNGLIVDNGGIQVTGSITSTAGFTGSFSGSVAGFPTDVNAFSSSLSTRITNSESTGSSLTTASGSFSTRTTAVEATASQYVTASGSLAARLTSNEAKTGSFATTGSNQFNGSQTITGSLTTTGTLTAQTLVVQTVTSSVVYSSGSNIFGLNSGNNHQFTGSVLVNGAVTTTSWIKLSNNVFTGGNDTGIFLTGATNDFSWGMNRETAGLTFYASSSSSPKLTISPTGNVGIGTSSPSYKFHVISSNYQVQVEPTVAASMALLKPAAATGGVNAFSVGVELSSLNSANFRYTYNGYGSTSNYVGIGFWGNDDILNVVANGKVGIGTTNPASALHVSGSESRFGGVASAYISVYNATGRSGYIQANGGTDLRVASDTDPMAFYVSGSERMRITSAGNVGIGTTSPSHPLSVVNPTGGFNTISMINSSSNIARLAFVQNGSTTLAYSAIEGDGRSTGYLAFRTNDTERMRITNDGLVGIGTTSPTRTFQITRTSTAFINAEGSVVALGSSDVELRLFGNNTETMTLKSGNVGIGTTSPTQKITTVGSYVRYHSLSEDNTNAGAYFQVKSGSTTVGQSSQFVDNTGNWIIYTGTSSESERMRITSDGRLGIGTTAPQYPLEVNGVIRSKNSSSVGDVYLGSTPAGVGYAAAAIKGAQSPSYSYTGKLSFYVTTWGANTDYGLTEQMYIETSSADNKNAKIVMSPFGGNVGIGTTSPDVKLQVRNDVNGNSLVAKFSNLDTNGGTGAYIGFNTGYDATARIGALREGSGNNSSLLFLPMSNETPTERMRITSGGTILIGTSATCKGLLRVAGDGEICKTLFFNGGEGVGGAIINAGVQLSCSTPSYNVRSMFSFNNQANYGAFMFIHTAYNTVTTKQGTITGIVTNGATQIVSIISCALEAGVSAPGVYSTSFFCLTFCWPNAMNSNTKFIALAG